MKIALIIVAVALLCCFAGKFPEMSRGANAASNGYATVNAETAKALIEDGGAFILLDVRTAGEYAKNRLDGARLIPHDEIKRRAERELPEKDARILVYCRSGRRSAIAAAELAALGYVDVYGFGGINDWPYDKIGD